MHSDRKTHRRDFLTGRSAVDALADLGDRLIPNEPDAPAISHDLAARPYLVQFSRSAMATQFEVFLNAGQYPQGPCAAFEALDLIERLEAQMTVFRDTSEIMAINRTAADGPVQVESQLFQLLQLAAELYRETQGALDITSGPLSKIWGFYRRQGSIPNERDLADTLTHVGFDLVRLDAEEQAVRFERAGVELNLGCIGKGYALDRAAARLVEAGVNDFLWHGGQSSVLARGRSGDGSSQGSPWWIGIRDPLRPMRRMARIRLCDRALATSGCGAQFFRHRGRRFGHILDPRSGWPADGVLSATAIAPTAALADALSTAFYVMGVEKTFEFCDQHPHVAAVMVRAAQRKGASQLLTAGISDPDLRLVEEAKALR